MGDRIELGDVVISVSRKAIKHIHLSVHPQHGRVTLVAPIGTRADVARAHAISKLPWIRRQQASFRAQPREPVRAFVTRESHLVWGRLHLLQVVERDEKPSVTIDHRRIRLVVRPGSDQTKRAEVIHDWHKSLLHDVLPPLIKAWEKKLRLSVARYFLQRMKTKWGSCNPRARTIRLNTELVRKPRDLLEYVVVHEMIHFLEPTHGKRFVTLLDRHYPTWREARMELNDLPLAAESWRE